MKKILGTLIIIALLSLTALTFHTASRFKTVEQQEAEAAPPPATTMTVTVTQEKFKDTTPVLCTIGYGNSTELTPTTELPNNAQYTKIAVIEGEELNQGSLIAEINGQPLFTGIGGFSFYRNLALGDTGPDAQLLNSILTDLGYQQARTGEEATTFNETSLQALGALYKSFGYKAPSKETGFTAASFIVLPQPQKIISQPRSTGTVSTGPIARISSTNQEITCKGLTGELSPEISSGMKLTLHTPNLEYTTTISTVERPQIQDTTSATTQQNATPATAYITAPTNNTLPQDTTQINAEVILSESSGNHPVVPASALWSKDGQIFVTRLTDNTPTDIPVKVLYSAQGLHEVEALTDTLTAGDTLKLITGTQE